MGLCRCMALLFTFKRTLSVGKGVHGKSGIESINRIVSLSRWAEQPAACCLGSASTFYRCSEGALVIGILFKW